jgi:hypothetical protein
MEGPAVAGEPLGQYSQAAAGGHCQLAADATIIGQADQAASSLQACLDLLLTPCIKDLMEQAMGQYG